MKLRRLLLSLAVSSVVSVSAFAENWAQWRGPALNGSTTETNLPEKLDPKGNLLWSVDLPGRGAATPIVWEDRVFVTSYTADKKIAAICFDRKTGKQLWQKQITEGFLVKNLADLASPSAVTDGKTVWFYFGTGDLAAFDLDGNPKWSRNLQKDHGAWNYQWIYGSSPLLHKGKLYIQVLHRDVPVGRGAQSSGSPAPSYLLAVDPETGKDLWKHIRPEDARAESKEAYGTPIPYQGKDREELIIVGGDVVTSHDPATGKELWRAGDWNPEKITHWRLVPSAVIADDLIIACAPKGGPVMAWKPGGSGNVTATHLAWQTTDYTADVPVPLYYQGNLYVLDDKKNLDCVDPKTGQKKWSVKLESRPVFRASPTGADGKIYCMNEQGQVWVVSANEPKILSETDLSGPNKAHATISVSGGQVFVRTGDKLYSFGKK